MPPELQSGSVTRRTFLNRLLRSCILGLGAGALGLAFWDRRGPGLSQEGAHGDLLPDYSIAGQAGKLSIVHGADRRQSVSAALAALGGMKSFINAGERVLLKVNAAFATPPLLGATTHPDLVTRVVELCLQAGAGRVDVVDNPINDPASCMALSGIGPAARSAGAHVILPMAERFESYTVPGGRLLRHWPVLCPPLRQADKVIGLAPVKDHHRSGASLTLKNWYGLLGGRRNIFHQQIHAIIVELGLMIKPTLVILDGTSSMLTNGPTGGSLDDLKPTHTLIAGTDPVAVDAVGATLLGKTPQQLPYLVMAEKAGLGRIDFKALKPVEMNV